MPDQRKQPGFVVAILALLGVFSLPQFINSPERGSPEPPAASNASNGMDADDDSEQETERDVRSLKPLVDFLSKDDSKLKTNEDLAYFICENLTNPKTSVYCLIVTLPGPVRSVASGRFDEDLDVVQRAIELQGYVLDRSRLPWKTASEEKGASPEKTTFRVKEKTPTIAAITPTDKDAAPEKTAIDLKGQALPPTIELTTSTKQNESRLGLMVFKHLLPDQPEEPSKTPPNVTSPSVLLTFLVPESPISGIDKSAFVESLNLIHYYFQAHLTHDKVSGQRALHIVAPRFNGSQRSLELAIKGWRRSSLYHFRVISSGAGVINQERFQAILPKGEGQVSFSSMVHTVTEVKDAMIEHLKERYKGSEIAVLVESNSGLAQALIRHEQKKKEQQQDQKDAKREQERANPKDAPPAPGNQPNSKPIATDSTEDEAPVEFIYPLQVSELRAAYEKADNVRDGKAKNSSGALKLRVPPHEGGTPADLPRAYTPATSAALDEMALTQVLTTIAHRPYKAVGIVATSPADVVFLAGQVARFCPNVRLFTLSSDLLLARPSEQVDLRGMLVASTYPLYPSNQWITTPFRDGARVFFSNRSAQGLYNATVAHLWEMSADEPDDPKKETVPQLLEFGHPYDVKSFRLRRPPVWISVVGERGLYPITYKTKGSSYLYNPQTAPEKRPLAKWPVDESTAAKPNPQVEARSDTASTASIAMQPRPHLFFWLICMFLAFVACPFVAVVTWVYVAWSVDPRKYEPDGHPTYKHLLKWLNCDVAEKVTVGAPPDRTIRGWRRRRNPPVSCELLFSPENNGNASIPPQPKNSIAARASDGRLWLRISDSYGQFEGLEPIERAGKDRKLTAQLGPLWRCQLSENEKASVLSAVGSIVGGQKYTGFDLLVWRANGGAKVFPLRPENLVAVGDVNGEIQLCVFDSSGKRVGTKPQANRHGEVKELKKKLKKKLERLHLRELTENDKAEVLRDVESLVMPQKVVNPGLLLWHASQNVKRFPSDPKNLVTVTEANGLLKLCIFDSEGRHFQKEVQSQPNDDTHELKRRLKHVWTHGPTEHERASIIRDVGTLYERNALATFDLCLLREGLRDPGGHSRNMVVLSSVKGQLNIGVYSSNGAIREQFLVDTLTERADDVTKLKNQIRDFRSRDLTDKEKVAVIGAVGAMIGRPQLGKGVYRDPRSKQFLDGRNFNPQCRYQDEEKNPFPPPSGAGASVALWNLVVWGLSFYFFTHVLIAMGTTLTFWPALLILAPLVISSASLIPAVFECFVKRPDHVAIESIRPDLAHRLRFFPAYVFRSIPCGVAYALFWMTVLLFSLNYIQYIPEWVQVDSWRLTYERFTSVPSGVSPVFPALFLALALAAAANFERSAHRSYRMSYMPSEESTIQENTNATHFERILIKMRKARLDVDRRLYKFWERKNVTGANLVLVCASIFIMLHIIMRLLYRGLPHSLETTTFDRVFWLFFMIAFVLVLFRTIQLSALWRQVKEMLHLAVELPLSSAYDRIPCRFKGWFFGEEGFEVREELIRQQSTAVTIRCSKDVADILHEVESISRVPQQAKPFLCRPTTTFECALPLGAVDAEEKAFAETSGWHSELLNMRKVLENSETLHSTRAVYAFLRPLWESQPVEDVPRHQDDDAKKSKSADWLESWPLTPWQRQQLRDDKNLADDEKLWPLTPWQPQQLRHDKNLADDEKLVILRDWARTAEDLVALQIVRWFAPALSNLVPMMQFLVLGSLSLLLAVTSYPFDHQSWLTTMMICLIVFIGVVVGSVLVGANRDELISRVSDTKPGSLNFDSNFVGSLLTIIGPLVGALIAVSFDISDLLRTWFGPLFQFF